MERDIVKRIEDLMDLFDEGEVTTADQIQRPEDPYRDFNERNPLAGGGMLVQPGFDGTRQEYGGRKAKKIKDYPLEIQQRIKEFGIRKYDKLNKFQKYAVRNQPTSTTPYTFNFKKNKFDITVKGLTKTGAKNIQNLLNLLAKNPNITPAQWFAKTGKDYRPRSEEHTSELQSQD